MTDAKRFSMMGHSPTEKPFHYKACGLDDVYLHSGFEVKETEYGPAVTIHDVEGLHETIAASLVEAERPLTPREFRFLRKQMSLGQEELATRLGIDVQTVARYEKGQTPIPRATEVVLRLCYILHNATPDEQVEFLEHLKELLEEEKRGDSKKADFSFTAQGWREGMAAH